MHSTKMSLEMTSSFFAVAGLVLGVRETHQTADGAVATRFEIFLHATEMELTITARSESHVPFCS